MAIKTIKAWIGIDEKGKHTHENGYLFVYTNKKQGIDEVGWVAKCTVQYEIKDKIKKGGK